ncbi:MAG: hypothetical protein Greene041614_313 [Parcubacteria group bacterium Greene0416_14]|nr:MAG: hypothetical protein Greene041614_313 [Parcubacteria group bacterium Greene0416_14]
MGLEPPLVVTPTTPPPPPVPLAPELHVSVETSTVAIAGSPVEDAPMVTDDSSDVQVEFAAILLGLTVNFLRPPEVTLIVDVPDIVVEKLASDTTILLIFAPDVTVRPAPFTESETESLSETSSPAWLVSGNKTTASVKQKEINNLRFIFLYIS